MMSREKYEALLYDANEHLKDLKLELKEANSCPMVNVDEVKSIEGAIEEARGQINLIKKELKETKGEERMDSKNEKKLKAAGNNIELCLEELNDEALAIYHKIASLTADIEILQFELEDKEESIRELEETKGEC